MRKQCESSSLSAYSIWTAGRRTALLASLAALMAAPAGAATVYWDQNLSTAGFQATASSGAWDTSAFWTPDSTGSSPGPWAAAVANDNFVFASGAANSNNTITLGSNFSAASVTLQNGRWAFSGTGGTRTLSIGSGGVTWAVPLGGTASGNSTFANTISIVLNGSQTWTNNANTNSNHIVVNGTTAGNASTGNTNTLTLTGGAGGSGVQFAGVVSNGANGGSLGVVVNNSLNAVTTTDSSFQLTAANTYSGKTVIQNGTLRIATLTNVSGGASSLGSVTTVADGTIDLGDFTSTGGLILNGSTAQTSNRVINLAGTIGGGVIKNSSTAATSTLTLTGGVTNAGGGNKTLTLGGTNTGNNTISGVIADGADFSGTAVSKVDAGLWNLNGANTYSGGTTISAGTLSVGSSGTLGLNDAINAITITVGNLLLSAASNVGANQTITISAAGGGIGVSYNPVSFPTIVDNSGATGGVFGINYTGTAGIGSVAGIDALFTGSSNWFLGSFVGGSGTYTGSSLTAGSGSNYRLGGGGGALTIQNNILTGANNLIVGSTGGGSVTLSNGNTYTGTTTLQNGTLNVAVLGNVGTAGSSIGAQSDANNAAILLGSGANAVVFNYTGIGEITDRQLRFVGTTGTVTLGNSGTGAVNYSAAPAFVGNGIKTIILGNTTDSMGGSIGALANPATGVTSVTKAGLTNSRWILTGGAGNTYTGTTLNSGGVLQTAAVTDLATSYVSLNGADTTRLGVWQTQGTIARTLSSTANAANLNWGANAGFAARGGKLDLNFSGGATQTWGAGGFLGTGVAPMVFGSSTADSQVELKNSFTLGNDVSNGFNRVIHVEKGAGGDSALISGVISQGVDTNASGDTLNNGFVKDGNGTLILSAANSYTGTTAIRNGTLVAAANSLASTNGAFGNSATAITLGDATTPIGANVALEIGGAYQVSRAVTISAAPIVGNYSVGGNTNNSATFSGLVTAGQNMSVTQVATTGGNALNITGGITGGANAAVKTVTFNNAGAVNVSTVGISDGAGGGKIALTQTGAGVTTLNAVNSYTGATTISAGTLLVNGSLAAGSAVALNGGTLGGSGTVNGLVTSGGTTAHLAAGNSPGVLTLAGGLNAAAGLSFDFELGTSSDRIDIGAFTGSTAAGGLVFNFSDSGGLAGGSPYTLLNFTSVSGLDYSDLLANVIPAGYLLDSSFGTGGFLIGANSLQVQFSAVPEPSTYALIFSGLGALALLRWRRKAGHC